MNIHIVCSGETRRQGILGRQILRLAKRCNWTIGDHPNTKADMQYLIPYSDLDKLKDATGPTAALFTSNKHHSIWQMAAKKVDLRLHLAAQMQESLACFGLTSRIMPGLDANWRSTPRPVAEQIVGISGDADWFHGVHLIERLLESELAKYIKIKAIGTGWPCECEQPELSKMVGWYQSLQVYLCTSIIDDVPFGPLEALACGIKVVVPRGVGMLDELPDYPGIVKYDAGDYESMEYALLIALSQRPDRGAMRSLIASYTTDAWVKSNHDAFLGFFNNKEYQRSYNKGASKIEAMRNI